MRSKIAFQTSWIFLILLSCATSSLYRSKHVEDLQKSYPYALLGDDHSVLAPDDLAINSCIATPVPFSNESISYPYWQCFEVKKADLFCDGTGYDKDEKEWLTVMVITAEREGAFHEYITRRAIPLTVCKEFVNDWNRLTKDEDFVCVAGAYTSRTERSGRWLSHWVFDRFKTSKGCESFFEGGCSLKHQLEHNCKLDEIIGWSDTIRAYDPLRPMQGTLEK
jgi:hypothetical protein